MTSRVQLLKTLILVGVAALCIPHGAALAQVRVTPPDSEPKTEFEGRAQLEAQAREAEAQHRTGEAWLLRNRLEKGDFQEGDRIVVILESTAAIQKSETLTVRSGKILQLRNMKELSLEGVLRSELTDRLQRHLAMYLKDP